MSKQKKVDAVLEQRRAHVARLGASSELLSRTRDRLSALQDQLSHLNADASEQAAIGPLRQALTSCVSQVDHALLQSQRLVNRLSAAGLAIGVVGQARTGKSRFLQSLTGLGPDTIPDSSGGYCTGVTSVIRPAPQFSATVTFKSEEQLLRQLSTYYAGLDSSLLPADLRHLPVPGEGPGAERHEWRRHLLGYIDAMPSLLPLVGSAPRAVDVKDVRRWVTQHDDRIGPLDEFRVVDHVEIAAPFADGLSGVSVVDLPGLGDTNLSDAPRMLSALEDVIDVVILLRRPDEKGDDWGKRDIELYQAVADALPSVPMSKRAFIVLNRVVHPDNAVQCSRFRESAGARGMAVAAVETVDAASSAEVSELFERVLDHVLLTAPEIDAALVRQHVASLAVLQPAFEVLRETVEAWFGELAEASPKHAQDFVRLRKQTNELLHTQLLALSRYLSQQRLIPDHGVQTATDEVLEAARNDKGLPTVEQIETMIDVKGGVSLAYGDLLNQARAHLGRHFSKLDPALDASLTQVKLDVGTILQKAGLSAIVEPTEPSWLSALADELTFVLDADSAIVEALRTLDGARLSYRGFLQHRVRPLLDNLNADDPRYPLEQANDCPAGLVRDMVEATYDDALGKVELLLRTQVQSEPGQAMFAVCEEFVDRLFRSRTSEDEWAAVFQHYKNNLWPDIWSAVTNDRADVQKIRVAIRDLEATTGDILTLATEPA